MSVLKLSPLAKTWLLDLDGTVVKHNGYKMDGHDTFLEGAEAFLRRIPETDMVVFITARTEDLRGATESFLRENDVRYDHIIFNAPLGERILVNDRKPSGLRMAVAIDMERDRFAGVEYIIDDEL